MSQSSAEQKQTTLEEGPLDDGGKTGLIVKIFTAACLSVGVIAAVYISIDPNHQSDFIKNAVAPLFAVIIATILASFPMIVGFVQATSRKRQMVKLQGIQTWPVSQTVYYKTAVSSLELTRPASVSVPEFRTPMILFCIALMVCTLSVFVARNLTYIFDYNSFVLGGTEIIGSTKEAINEYQAGTYTAMAYAFIGAYISIIARLLSRINNNDIYPSSFHFYTAWIITAGLVAVVARHVLHLIAGSHAPDLIILIGFGAGLAPNLFLAAIARRAFNYLRIIGDKSDPDESSFPTNLNLLMIKGITSDQIDRLGELGVMNADILGNQNPFLLWPRLPYDLWQLVEWIAQAQLYARVQEYGLKNLRDHCVGNIFDFTIFLQSNEARPIACKCLNIDDGTATALLQCISEDVSYVRLKEVSDLMKAV